MVKCVFCGREDSLHKGVHLIKNDGSINYFCSSKCRVNATKLGRDKKKLKWTDAYRIEKVKLENSAKRKAEEAKEKSKVSAAK